MTSEPVRSNPDVLRKAGNLKSAPFGVEFFLCFFWGAQDIWATFVRGIVLYACDICCIYDKIVQKYIKCCEINKNI